MGLSNSFHDPSQAFELLMATKSISGIRMPPLKEAILEPPLKGLRFGASLRKFYESKFSGVCLIFMNRRLACGVLNFNNWESLFSRAVRRSEVKGF